MEKLNAKQARRSTGPFVLVALGALLFQKWTGYISTLNYKSLVFDEKYWLLLIVAPIFFSSLRLISRLKTLEERVISVFYVGLFIVPNGLSVLLYQVPPQILIVAWLGFWCAVRWSLSFSGNKNYDVVEEKGTFKIISWLAMLCTLYFFYIHRLNVNVNAIFLEDIYEWRFAVTEKRHFIENVAFSTTTKLLIPLLLSRCLTRKEIGYFVFWLVVLIYLFSTSNQKSILFSVILIVGYHVFFSFKTRVWPSVLSLTWVVGLMVTTVGDDIIVRRLLFLPTYLNKVYWEYFEEPLFLSHSVLKWIFYNRYTDLLAPPWRIGWEYWGLHVSLNNGIISDGILNFGVIGGVVYVLISLRILFGISRRVPSYGVPIILIYLWQLVNSALITTFVLHGLFMFYLISRKIWRCAQEE